MKDYLQPAATMALALAIGSLPFTIPMGVRAYGDHMEISGTVQVESTPSGYLDVRGCN